MFRKILCISLVLALLLTGCEMEYLHLAEFIFLDLFDTVTSVVGRADSEEEFQTQAQAVYNELQEYHQLFDIYNEYEGINNLKTINDQAGKSSVQVDERIIQLLTDCREFYEVTGGKVNIAMGSVLRLWHEARNEGLADPLNAKLPEKASLEAAA